MHSGPQIHSQREDIAELFKKSVEAYGKIDILVNNAGAIDSLPNQRQLLKESVNDPVSIRSCPIHCTTALTDSALRLGTHRHHARYSPHAHEA